MQTLIYSTAILALSMSPSVFGPAHGNLGQLPSAPRPLESTIPAAHAQENQEQVFMLERMETTMRSSGCLETAMGVGCRMQSRIPAWNQYAGIFAARFGFTCPVSFTGL